MASTRAQQRLDGKVIVITGASSGIGRAAALALCGRGAAVVLAARSEGPLAQAAADCGPNALAVVTDVSDPQAVSALASAAVERFGRIDVWLNCAGVIAYGGVEQVPEAVYRQVLDTNFFGQLYGARAALAQFRAQGHGVLINMSSVWGAVSSPFVSPYLVSKFAIRAFSEALAQELWLQPGTRDIHVCTILPQAVRTPIFARAANYSGRRVRRLPLAVSTDRVVAAIVAAILQPRRRRRSVGIFGRLLELFHALAPGAFGRVVAVAMDRLGFHREPAAQTVGNVFAPSEALEATDGE